MLALLAVSPGYSLSRDKLMAYLWPERDAEHARLLLNQSVRTIRKALGTQVLRTAGDELRLDVGVVNCDVVAFEGALAARDPERAISLYRGPFLDGFGLSDAPEFERWEDRERDRLAGGYVRALEALAEAAEARQDFLSAAEWWRARAAHDPYDSRVALRLMQALEASGNRAGALQLASVHHRLLQEDFGVEPPPELQALADRLRHAAATRLGSALGRPPVAMPAPSTPETAAVPAMDGATALSEPVPSSPAPRRISAVFWWSTAVFLLGAVPFGAIWLGSTRGEMPPPPAEEHSVAVLPFANLSAEPEEEYFSDGLTEDLIGALSQVRALRVVARTSAFAFKGQRRDVRDIGRALNVTYVVEGSVRREGDRLRITAQLIDARTGYHLRSETYERQASDLFAIQSDLALRIATAMATELTARERARLARHQTESLEAHRLYLKGRYFWHQRSPAGLTRAIEYFQRSIEADPQYATAHAGLASVYGTLGVLGYIAPSEGRELMRGPALKAVALDPDLSEAHTALAAYLYAYEWDWGAAEREYRRAIELDPSFPTAHGWYSFLLATLGRFEEALEEAQKCVDLEPLAPMEQVRLGASYIYLGRPELALEPLRNAIELDSMLGHRELGWAYEALGQREEALREFEKAAHAMGGGARARAWLARGLVLAGREGEARRILESLRAEPARTGVYNPATAVVFLALGDTSAAFAWLDESARQRHAALPHTLVEPGFDSLRDHPRFVALRRRLRLRE
jgi:serine/threonine-protein kinase